MTCHVNIGGKVYNEKNFILISFLFLQIIKYIFSSTYAQESISIWILRIAVLIIYAVLSFLTYKKNTTATIILALIIAVSGLGSLTVAFFMDNSQLILKIISIIFGLFFTICGIRLFVIQWRDNHKGQRPT